MWHGPVVDECFIFVAEHNEDSSDDLTEYVSFRDNVASGVAKSLLLGQP